MRTITWCFCKNLVQTPTITCQHIWTLLALISFVNCLDVLEEPFSIGIGIIKDILRPEAFSRIELFENAFVVFCSVIGYFPIKKTFTYVKNNLKYHKISCFCSLQFLFCHFLCRQQQLVIPIDKHRIPTFLYLLILVKPPE